MKKFRRTFFSLVVFSVLCMTFVGNTFSQNNNGNCVKCVGAGHGWICQAAPGGGDACTTDGYNCTLINPCPSFGGANCPPNAQDPTKPKIILNISDELVREVGKSNPRLGVALIGLRNLPPLSYSKGMINTAPVELSQNDIEEQLAATASSKDYVAQLRVKTGEAFKKGLLPTVYNFSIEPSSAPDAYILKLQTAEVGSFGSLVSIDINLSEMKEATRDAKEPTRALKAGSWKID